MPAQSYSNGQTFFPGLPPSSESQWAPTVGGPEPYAVATSHFKYLVFANPAWDWRTFNPDTAVPLAQSVQAAGLDSMDPNLAPIQGARRQVDHDARLVRHQRLREEQRRLLPERCTTMGGTAQTTDFFRLFMAPGVDHCGGGPGPRRH